VVPGEFGEFLPQPPGSDALEAVDQPGQRDRRGKGDEQADVLSSPVNSASSHPIRRRGRPLE
jgi:hypothetical protein